MIEATASGAGGNGGAAAVARQMAEAGISRSLGIVANGPSLVGPDSYRQQVATGLLIFAVLAVSVAARR